MNTYIYIDGLNLYYGAVKGTLYKWLDLAAMCRRVLPHFKILQIRYFTAIVQARRGDPDAPTRQQFYLRALRTIPNLTMHFGQFLSHERTMPLASSQTIPPQTVRVIRTDEKGSDVNLATYLLLDGFRASYDVAVVVSNDSDLAEPIRVTRHELGKTVGLLNPQRKKPVAQALRRHLNFSKPIREGVLAASQFPVTLTDHAGTFSKPASW